MIYSSVIPAPIPFVLGLFGQLFIAGVIALTPRIGTRIFERNVRLDVRANARGSRRNAREPGAALSFTVAECSETYRRSVCDPL